MIERISRAVRAYGIPMAGLRAAEALLKPRGVSLLSFLGYGADRGGVAQPSTFRFDQIAAENRWGSSESISGVGSELAYTQVYRKALASFLGEYRVQSMFDAPCGDLNWIKHVIKEVDIKYIGGDISQVVIEANRRAHPEISSIQFDITKDAFPDVELWHCRDCMFHLSDRDIWAALENFSNSTCEFALLTFHSGWLRNLNIESGGFRYLDLRKPPFNFPAPERLLTDYRVGVDFPRFVGVWRRKQVADVLHRSRAG